MEAPQPCLLGLLSVARGSVKEPVVFESVHARLHVCVCKCVCVYVCASVYVCSCMHSCACVYMKVNELT